jgi:ornithine cyclodeaminase
MLAITSTMIENSGPLSLWVDSMEKALLEVKSNQYFTPDRMHMEMGENTLLLMPSAGPDSFATKLVTVFPGNTKQNKAVIQGIVMLNDAKTGELKAIFNGSKITAMRTAAVANLGIRYLTEKSIDSIGIIGAGFQGRHIAWMANSERPLKTIYVFDYSEEVIKEFKDFLKERAPNINIVVCKDAQEVLSRTSTIITATASQTPVLPDHKDLLKDKCFIGVGSYKPDMQEFPHSLFQLVDHIYIDAEHGKKESGDLIEPVKQNWIDSSQIKMITEVFNQNNTHGTRLYKTVGQGIFDLFTANLVYDNCKELKSITKINL